MSREKEGWKGQKAGTRMFRELLCMCECVRGYLVSEYVCVHACVRVCVNVYSCASVCVSV